MFFCGADPPSFRRWNEAIKPGLSLDAASLKMRYEGSKQELQTKKLGKHFFEARGTSGGTGADTERDT